MLSFIRNNYHYEVKLYNKILSFSRNKYFYDQIRLADTYQVRILLIFFHFSFVIINLNLQGKSVIVMDLISYLFFQMFLIVKYLLFFQWRILQECYWILLCKLKYWIVQEFLLLLLFQSLFQINSYLFVTTIYQTYILILN